MFEFFVDYYSYDQGGMLIACFFTPLFFFVMGLRSLEIETPMGLFWLIVFTLICCSGLAYMKISPYWDTWERTIEEQELEGKEKRSKRRSRSTSLSLADGSQIRVSSSTFEEAHMSDLISKEARSFNFKFTTK